MVVVVIVECFWEVSHATYWKIFTDFDIIEIIIHLNQRNFYKIGLEETTPK